MIESIIEFLHTRNGHILSSAVLLVGLLAVDRVISPKLEQSVDDGNFKPRSASRAIYLARLISITVFVLVNTLIWGIKISSLLVFSTTMLTLLGVALFAQWSIISNVTAFFILLTHPSIKRGNYIRVLDMDNYVEGYVSELNLFSATLITENREVLIYPNNLLLSRPMMVNPRSRWAGIGKVLPEAPPDQAAG